MSYKQGGIALLILIVLFAIFGLWSAYAPKTAAPVAQTHVLQGQMNASGDLEYVDEGNYYTAQATYPGDTGLSPSADAKARLTIEQTIADQIAQFKKDTRVETLTPEDAAFQNLSADRKYSFNMEFKKYTSPEYVSYLYAVYEDTGGAHPNATYLSLVFNKEGERVALANLFPTSANLLQKLSAAVTASVTAQFKERTGTQDIEGLLFTEGLSAKEENFSNFAVDGTTLRIFIPPYQVAAYAAGSFEVAIPISQLQ